MALHVGKTNTRLAKCGFASLLVTMVVLMFSVIQLDIRTFLPVITLGLLVAAFIFFFVLEIYCMLYDMFQEPITNHTISTIGFTLSVLFITATVTAFGVSSSGWKLGCVYGMVTALATMLTSKLLKWVV